MHPHQIWRPVVAMALLVVATMLATTTVVVESGDTLSTIADRHGVTVADLVEWNDIDDPDRIYAGTTLIVSAPDADGATAVADDDIHVVTAGDTLSAIARRFGVTVGQIVAANELDDPDRIYEGQTLALRGTVAAATTTTTAPARTYTVVAGDTLWGIASRHGISVATLAEANGIDDIDRIREGLRLVIDGAASSDPEAASTTTTTTTAPPSETTTTVAPEPTPPPVTNERDADEILLVPMFSQWSTTYDVPQDLLEAIAWKESNWRPDAIGAGGHLGLLQFSPATVELIEGGLLGRDLDPLAADDAIQMGARYLRYLLDRTETEDEAIAAWAQGLASVQGDGITTAGAAYVASVREIRQQRS